MVLPDSHRVPRVPWYLGATSNEPRSFRLQVSHLLRPAFPGLFSYNPGFLLTDRAATPSNAVPLPPMHNARRLSHAPGLGSSLFARRYWGNRFCFLFLRVLRWFTSPGSPLAPYFTQGRISQFYSGSCCKIRTPPDHSLFAAPRGFSQLATSFLAFFRQGIHRMPLVA